MHLHLDGIIFSLQRYGGISVYFRELLRRMSPQESTVLSLEGPLQQADVPAGFPAVGKVERSARRLERVRRCRAVDRFRADLFHSSYYRRPPRPGLASVVTVHDFVHERFVPGPRGRLRRWLVNGAIAEARHIICISEATRQDLLEFAPPRPDQRVSVIHNGVADVFRPLPSMQSGSCATPFVLFIGQRGGYKNFALAVQAMAHLPDVELHCVGGGPLLEAELAGVPAAVRQRVRHLGFVDDEQLNALYNRALCLLYPSAYEGFGIPVLEAMRAGCPVVAIDCRAVMEVGGPALCVSQDPNDPRALAQAVERTAAADTRASLRSLGLKRGQMFNWDRCFQETAAVYRLHT